MKEIVSLKVAGNTNVKALSGSISHLLKGDGGQSPKSVELLTIGASSCNQAFKACAISAGHVAEWGGTLKIRPGFRMGEINGEEKTIMRFLVECE